MKLSKERAVYAAVLGVGLLALIVDRAMLSPAGAAADTVAPPATAEATPPTPGEKTAAPAPQQPLRSGLAERLRSEGGEWVGSVRNGFKAAETWIAPPQVVLAAEERTDEVDIFVNSHTLTVVQASETANPLVIVNGTILKIGGEIDGWKLASVMKTGAEFRKGEFKAVLELKIKSAGVKTSRSEGAPSPAPVPGQAPAPELEPEGEKK